MDHCIKLVVTSNILGPQKILYKIMLLGRKINLENDVVYDSYVC